MTKTIESYNGTLFEGQELEHELNKLKIDLISRFFHFTFSEKQKYEPILNHGVDHLIVDESDSFFDCDNDKEKSDLLIMKGENIQNPNNDDEWEKLSESQDFNWNWEFIKNNYLKLNINKLSSNKSVYDHLIKNQMTRAGIILFLDAYLKGKVEKAMFNNPSEWETYNGKNAIDGLFKNSLKIRKSEEFCKFFNFIARFNHYSRYNTMLVYIQNRTISFFGGASYWKKEFNRKVIPDARPYIILAPKGPVMLAYDIFDTIGSESAESFLERGLGQIMRKTGGFIDENKFKKAFSVAENMGITILIKPLSYFNGGYITTVITNKLEICLKEGDSRETNYAVLIHELAHLFLGHTGHKELNTKINGKTIKISTRKLTQTAEELEAETVSYLVCYKVGLECRSAEYLAGYIKNPSDLVHFSYENVIKTADKIESLFL